MQYFLEHLGAQAASDRSLFGLSALQRAYVCHCSRAVFFQNSRCLACQTPLGYEPQSGQVLAIEKGHAEGLWRVRSTAVASEAATKLYRRCANLHTPAGCNWLIVADDGSELCIACRLNRIIPDLSIPENGILWARLEDAKRRVVSALLSFGLPVQSKVTEDAQCGLAFDFLVSPKNGPRVLTGHANGLITINIEEADSVRREQMRTSLHEPYRTLVGHFRHEVGHYYWDRLVRGTTWHPLFRELFGNEQIDYAAALRANYEQGPPTNWPQQYVSAYASVHPWEDWAETWAHYMHMVDTLGTALSFGLDPERIAMPFEPFSPDVLYESSAPEAKQFLPFVNSWIKLSAVMNELCRSMGQPDFYPFALPKLAVTKLHFVHRLVCETSAERRRSKPAAA